MLDNMIYQNLKREMYRRRVNINDIANELGVSGKTVRNYFNGQTEISLKYAIKIKNKLFKDVDLIKLFE